MPFFPQLAKLFLSRLNGMAASLNLDLIFVKQYLIKWLDTAAEWLRKDLMKMSEPRSGNKACVSS